MMMRYILRRECYDTNTKTGLCNLKNHEFAFFLNRLLGWLQGSGKVINDTDGLWIYNSLKSLSKQLHFWSPSKIRRIIKALEDIGVLLSKKVNARKWNHTKWYTIDMERLEEMLRDPFYTNLPSHNRKQKNTGKKLTDRSAQNEQIIRINNYTIIRHC